MLLEGCNHLPAYRRGNIVGNETLCPQVFNRYPLLPREGMSGVDHEGQLVGVNRDRPKEVAFGAKRQNTDLYSSLQQIVWDFAGERALDAHPYLWAEPAKPIQYRKQVETGKLVGCNQQPSTVERLQLLHGADCFRPEVHHPAGIVA